MAKWGMVIDLDKCTGCQACSTACQMENNRLPGENYQDVLYYSEGKQPAPVLKWFPRPCMQCEEPSCMHVCPTKATYKTEDGVVLIDWNKCIGCKYCMIACPYGVRFYTDSKPLVEPNLKDVYKGEGDLSWNPPYKGPQQDNTKGIGILRRPLRVCRQPLWVRWRPLFVPPPIWKADFACCSHLPCRNPLI